MSQTDRPLVSVIVPCYNAERFLAETIESVLAQTLASFELILVDDGSTDGTAEILRSYTGDPRLRIDSGPNRGASAARNRGTELSRGELIQYLDADDLLRPTALERKVDALQASGADVAYSDWQRLEEGTDGAFHAGPVVARKIEDVHPDPRIATFTSFWVPPAALLYRRPLVERIGGWRGNLPVIQDARFLQDAARCGARFVRVEEVLADYREHRGPRLSRGDRVVFVRDILTNTEQTEGLWRRDGELSLDERRALLQAYKSCSHFFFWRAEEEFLRSSEHAVRLAGDDLPLGSVRLRHALSRSLGYRTARGLLAPWRAIYLGIRRPLGRLKRRLLAARARREGSGSVSETPSSARFRA